MSNERVRESLKYLNECFSNKTTFSEFTVIGEYLTWLTDQIKENKENPLYRDTYLPIIQENKKHPKDVFASVIMRTQGRRPEALREALLCLYAQSDRDFEVIIMGHRVNAAQKNLIESILDEFDLDFRKKIRFITLNEGTRTTPINYGFSMASGEYVIVFDDDDLLFEDWIRNFHDAAKKAPGTLLHTYALAQKWKVDENLSGGNSLYAVSAPDAKYCVDFDLIRQLSLNQCPLMTIAFPKNVFHDFGFIYDESLTTTEDWDYIMRVAFICGVTDVKEPGAIYRLWENAENSSVIHSQDEWKNNYNIIRKKHKRIPIVLSKGKAHEIELALQERVPSQASGRIMDDKLYYGCDKEWSEERSMVMKEPCTLGSFEMVYEGLTGKHTHHQLRWDPASYGDFFIRNLGASVTDAQGNTYYFKSKDIHSTGEFYHNGIIFLKDDPQVYFDIPSGFSVERFNVWGESILKMPIWENHKALKIFIMLKKALAKLHIIK